MDVLAEVVRSDKSNFFVPPSQVEIISTYIQNFAK